MLSSLSLADAGAWAIPERERLALYDGWVRMYEEDRKKQLQEAVHDMQTRRKELQAGSFTP